MKTAKNGRKMLSCVCSECDATKTRFISGQTCGAVGDFACGYNLRGKRAGTIDECFKRGQIRYWGLNRLDDGQVDRLLSDRRLDRNRKARERRQAKKPIKKLNVEIPNKEDFILPDPDDVRFSKLMREWAELQKPVKKPAKKPQYTEKERVLLNTLLDIPMEEMPDLDEPKVKKITKKRIKERMMNYNLVSGFKTAIIT